MGRGWKAEIRHVGGVGHARHDKANGQCGGDPHRAVGGQGNGQVQDVPLLSRGKATDG